MHPLMPRAESHHAFSKSELRRFQTVNTYLEFGFIETVFNVQETTTMAARIKLIALLLISLFFIAFGVLLMISAYSLKNPFEFIITFFAASFIILISATLCLGFVWQLIRLSKPAESDKCSSPETE